MVNRKQKGDRGERGLANWLREQGCSSARRTQQYCGTEGTSDVVAEELSMWHIEHKATKTSKLPPSLLLKWLEQVENDCPADKLPVIINTANQCERIAILPARTHQKLFPRSILSYDLNWVVAPTLEGEACSFINYLTSMYNIEIVNASLYNEEVQRPPNRVLCVLGAVKKNEVISAYSVILASEWVRVAKEVGGLFEALQPNTEQTLSET